MHRSWSLGAAMVFVTAGGALLADAPVSDATSPAVRAAIGELSSDSFKAREKAVQDLRAALAEQMRVMVASKEAGATATAIAALDYETGLSRWALETLKLSNEQRKAAVKFGMKSEVTAVLARAFSPNTEKRVEGIKALAKLEDDQATALLARLMEDPERKVYLAAMEAAGERKPTRELVDAVWNHAIGPNLLGMNPSIIMIMNANGNGGDAMDFSGFRQMNEQDCDKAAEMLIKFKSSRVTERLVAAAVAMENLHARSVPGTAPLMFNMSGPMRSFFRLLEAEKPREAFGPIYRIAIGPTGQVMNAQGQFYASSRTGYIAEFVKLIGEKPEDYKMKTGKVGPGVWSFLAPEDETNAVGKLRDWWEKHGSEYEGATTAPAEAEH